MFKFIFLAKIIPNYEKLLLLLFKNDKIILVTSEWKTG